MVTQQVEQEVVTHQDTHQGKHQDVVTQQVEQCLQVRLVLGLQKLHHELPWSMPGMRLRVRLYDLSSATNTLCNNDTS